MSKRLWTKDTTIVTLSLTHSLSLSLSHTHILTLSLSLSLSPCFVLALSDLDVNFEGEHVEEELDEGHHDCHDQL